MKQLKWVEEWEDESLNTTNTGFSDRDGEPIMLNQAVWVEGLGLQMVREYQADDGGYCVCCPEYVQMSRMLNRIRPEDIQVSEFLFV